MRTSVFLLVLSTAVSGAVSYVEAAEQPLKIAVQAAQGEYVVGTPVLLKLTVRNTSTEPKEVECLGWGRGIKIRIANGDEDFRWLEPAGYVTHADTDIGPLYVPAYFIKGILKPGEEQSILQMIYTEKAPVGRLRFKATLLGRESEEVAVTLVAPPNDVEHDFLTPEEREWFPRRMAYLHNQGVWGVGLTKNERAALMRIASKALEATTSSVETEYALYAGVYQAVSIQPSTESIVLAEQCAKALVERFPNTWLRAHVDAALVLAHIHRARMVAEQGLEEPLGRPLFEGLGITGWLDKTPRGRLQ